LPSAAGRRDAPFGEARNHPRVADDAVHFVLAVRHRLRRSGGGEQSGPGARLKSGKAGLAKSRHVGELGVTPGDADGSGSVPP
jgi:hypothetical protein